mmetsp:Transcript_15519/g.46874  ORF Transcript_15519/g.46874 Transcript_15519/m.46874 type:complete len:203 (+) Transcript_15519:76-684(+)|eukprot:CAMPEP_0206134510 /NCGR_PEP_ID=MMETSP1473-20131121/51_1 /ASSEMBLY_ACC=CAM_ASM_001109 /TAXON_ID=1461547 /ORGANISM="Stichococcus sp, Strain RCC1054" /LENGTH=202 /DNA_ID=CAMNT_0053526123 /DNA_START=277 /DNA_END=885 /DNA_ORIENTATION=-
MPKAAKTAAFTSKAEADGPSEIVLHEASSGCVQPSSRGGLHDKLLHLLDTGQQGHVHMLVTDVDDEAADDDRVHDLRQQQFLAGLQQLAQPLLHVHQLLLVQLLGSGDSGLDLSANGGHDVTEGLHNLRKLRQPVGLRKQRHEACSGGVQLQVLGHSVQRGDLFLTRDGGILQEVSEVVVLIRQILDILKILLRLLQGLSLG